MLLSFCLLVAALAPTLVVGQPAVYPFTVVGILGSVNIIGTEVNSGGSVSVSGYNIRIPDNLLVDFPATQVPFAEFAASDRAGPNEVSIIGNVVGETIIAGQMAVSQLSLQASNGIIESLSFDGAIKLLHGPTIRINDPRARYSSGTTAVPIFTADDENPSITSFGGFPMCVPRSGDDPLCPQSNRPTTVPNPKNYFIPNPMLMAPLKVGDYVEFSYIEFGGELLCYALTANVGIYTTAGTAPGFILVEDALIGVIDNNPDVEFARARFVGYTTDPNTLVSIYAIDINPCTGAESDRLIGSATPENVAGGRSKWEWRSDRQDIGYYTRNYRVKLASGQKLTTNGILSGQYVQPVTEWIFPEVITPGAVNPPVDFSGIGPLANGFGPYSSGKIFRQLTPWPGATPPTPISICIDPVTSVSVTTAIPEPTETGTEVVTATTTVVPTITPVPLIVDAGSDQTVRGGVRVTLSGAQTAPNIPTADLTYKWSQIGGSIINIEIASPDATVTTLNLPVNLGTTNEVREFLLLITHVPSGSVANDTIVITADKTSIDHPVIETFTWQSKQSGTVAVTVRTELVDASASMKCRFGNGAEVLMTRAGPGVYTYAARSTPRPASVTVRSYFGTVAVGVGVTRTGVTLL
ncbi:hypothetical protein VE03_08323 [Pseudogymnoascus sp. 23342-1-I1]|nr:hypothetical protein VE03_08323 [Pseudogymnoascus sp. 23342-1-I1]